MYTDTSTRTFARHTDWQRRKEEEEEGKQRRGGAAGGEAGREGGRGAEKRRARGEVMELIGLLVGRLVV